MKKKTIALFCVGLALTNLVQARQILDKTNKFYINLPDRYLLEAKPTTTNKNVVLEAYDPVDDASFTIKITPTQVTEISGLALDNERTKFRTSLQKLDLDPYVEGLLHIAPNHESIYCFSRMNDQGEVLNYLTAKFWAHNKEYSFFCIQPTKTLRTQEFIDAVDSFICMQHADATIPYPEEKKRPEYDKAKDQHDSLVKKAHLESEKLLAEGKQEEAEAVLKAVPEFTELPVEYIPLVEINSGKPLPADITDKVAHDALYSEHPEQVYAAAAKQKQQVVDNVTTGPIMRPEYKEEVQEQEQKQELVEGKDYITPPPIQRTQQEGGVTIIRNGKAVQDYSKTPPKHQEPALTKEEIKKMEKMKKEQEKFEKEQAKRQAELDKLRKKELARQKKELEKELKKNR